VVTAKGRDVGVGVRGSLSTGGGNERGSGVVRADRIGRGDLLGRVLSLAGFFSGLLGGVLNGEMRGSLESLAEAGTRLPMPRLLWEEEIFAGLAGTFGLSALLTGGGTDVLFCFPMGEGTRDNCGTPTEPPKGEPGLVARNTCGGLCHDADLGDKSGFSGARECQFLPV
jgi:hypothetical protein